MRKNAGLIIMTLLLLIVPALANAWTLTVKVVGGTDTNNVSVSYGTPAVTKVFKSTISYMYPTGKVTVAAAAGFTSMTLDDAGVVNGVLEPTSGNHVLQVTYAATQADAGVAIDQNLPAGGVIYAQNRNSTWSSTKVEGLLAGSKVEIAIAADSLHKIVSYSLDGKTQITTGVTGEPGQVLSVQAVAAKPYPAVTAIFGWATSGTAELHAPDTVVNGKKLNVSVTAVTNDAIVKYELSTDGTNYALTNNYGVFSVDAVAGTTYHLKARVTTTHNSFVTATKNVTVTSEAADANTGCSSCHGTQSPQIFAYGPTGHECTQCHTAEPHSPGSLALTPFSAQQPIVEVGTFKTMTTNVKGLAQTGALFCSACHVPEINQYSVAVHAADVKGPNCAKCHVLRGPGDVHSIAPVTEDTSAATCVSCHAETNSDFSGSKHWVNSKEYGPEFEGGAVNGEINPNESWTTTENGVLTTCSIRCHFKPNLGPNPYAKDTVAVNRPGKDACLACHNPHDPFATASTTCLECHSGNKHGKVPREFHASKHWINSKEYGPEFTGGAVEGEIDPNNSWTTKENGVLTTCAIRCHFNPGGGADKKARNTGGLTWTDPQTNEVHTRPGGSDCLACHEAHKLDATYKDTCLTCHSGSKHGVVPREFFASKHWISSKEYGPEFANQIKTTVNGGSVVANGIEVETLNANDSYTTTENGAVVTCAYRCHFRPGMGPQKDVAGYLAKGKSTTYITYTDSSGKVYSRPGGDACMACHDAHGLEATARSTCYTCHAGGNHGWSVKAFEKSTHYTGTHAIAEGIGGPAGKACTSCHNAHSLEASFVTMSSATMVKSGVGCQQCHAPGPYGIFNADRTGKAPHFKANAGAYVTARTTCADCHGHNNTINKGWAESGHGSTTNQPFNGGTADDWKSMGSTTSYAVDPSARSCNRCHTAKGFARFVDSRFTDVTPLQAADPEDHSSEPLVCSGCHASVEKGTLRLANFTSAKGYTARYGIKNADTTNNQLITSTIKFNNMQNSNICVPCHSQRGSGQEIKDVYAAGSFKQYSTGSNIYGHAAQPAGIVDGKGGYDFTTPTTTVNGHQTIGAANKQGPCVGCHMTSGNTHSLEAVNFGNISTVNGKSRRVVSSVCVSCHDSAFGVDDILAKKDDFNQAVKVLGNLLTAKGLKPGERTNFDWSQGTKNRAVAEKNQGAWFNWALFTEFDAGIDAEGSDRAAYLHNPSYAKQLIRDSIDWLDDNQINQSAAATINDLGKSGLSGAQALLAANFVNSAMTSTVAGNHLTTGTYKTQYLAGSSNCATCHNPAETDLQKEARQAWAESAHGEVAGAAWVPSSSHLWSTSGSTVNFATATPASDCVRCHTADGFTQFATGSAPFTNVKALPGDGKTNSPLNCQACHVDGLTGTSARLEVPAVTTFYNVSTVDKVSGKTVKSRIQAAFPNVGESNLCISCHAGRVSGPNLTELATKNTDWDLSNSSFQNSHYMAAAGVMYMKSGFINFTTLSAPAATNKEGSAFASNKTYAKTLMPDSASTPGGISGGQTSTHRMIGTTLLAGAEGKPASQGGETPYLGESDVLSKEGPCVNCHIQAYHPQKGDAAAADNPLAIDLYDGPVPAKRFGAGHSLTALDTETIKQICLPCHSHTKGLNLENFMAVKVEPAKVPYQDALELIKKLLLNTYKISYDGLSYPYFYDENLPLKDGKKQSVTDWTRKGVAGMPANGMNMTEAYRLQGACFNLNLLSRDPGGYVHARTYTQRLQYDTVDFLDDRVMNFSALNTARSVYPDKFFGNNANTGYLGDDYPVASEAILWLAGTHPNNNEIEPPNDTDVLRLKLRP